MTTLTEAREAIYQLFSDTWTPTGHPFTFDNEKFDPPNSAPWARLIVRHNEATQDTLGKVTNRKFLRRGSVLIQVYTPVNQGARIADGLVTTARNAFEGEDVASTTIFFRDVVVREIGPLGAFYQVNIEAEFEYEEVR